jgi:hypothetical protein
MRPFYCFFDGVPQKLELRANLLPPKNICALSQKKVKDPTLQKVNKNTEHEGDEKTEEMIMKGISDIDKNKEEKIAHHTKRRFSCHHDHNPLF